jgi:hypothetical protein
MVMKFIVAALSFGWWIIDAYKKSQVGRKEGVNWGIERCLNWMIWFFWETFNGGCRIVAWNIFKLMFPNSHGYLKNQASAKNKKTPN